MPEETKTNKPLTLQELQNSWKEKHRQYYERQNNQSAPSTQVTDIDGNAGRSPEEKLEELDKVVEDFLDSNKFTSGLTESVEKYHGNDFITNKYGKDKTKEQKYLNEIKALSENDMQKLKNMAKPHLYTIPLETLEMINRDDPENSAENKKNGKKKIADDIVRGVYSFLGTNTENVSYQPFAHIDLNNNEHIVKLGKSVDNYVVLNRTSLLEKGEYKVAIRDKEIQEMLSNLPEEKRDFAPRIYAAGLSTVASVPNFEWDDNFNSQAAEAFIAGGIQVGISKTKGIQTESEKEKTVKVKVSEAVLEAKDNYLTNKEIKPDAAFVEGQKYMYEKMEITPSKREYINQDGTKIKIDNEENKQNRPNSKGSRIGKWTNSLRGSLRNLKLRSASEEAALGENNTKAIGEDRVSQLEEAIKKAKSPDEVKSLESQKLLVETIRSRSKPNEGSKIEELSSNTAETMKSYKITHDNTNSKGSEDKKESQVAKLEERSNKKGTLRNLFHKTDNKIQGPN